MITSLSRRLLAEGMGTAALLMIVVGSGHMGETLSPANPGVALLANAIATGLGLWVLIEIFGQLSGAHFNPIVTITFALKGELRSRDAVAYCCIQIVAACFGVWIAHAMFDLPTLQLGIKVRSGVGQWISETIATAGLLGVIFAPSIDRRHIVPMLVAAYITSAYWFTASTSFANPAVTIARALTTTFAGIRPMDVTGFVIAQIAGCILFLIGSRLFNRTKFDAPRQSPRISSQR